MPHVELSVSEPYVARPRPTAELALERWAAAVTAAEEPSLVINDDEIIVAISASFAELLGRREPSVGLNLLDVLLLLDFTADGAELPEGEVGKIPPLLALSSAGLARGLVRLQCAGGSCMFDAVAAPLTDGGQVIGSLTFFSTVRP